MADFYCHFIRLCEASIGDNSASLHCMYINCMYRPNGPSSRVKGGPYKATATADGSLLSWYCAAAMLVFSFMVLLVGFSLSHVCVWTTQTLTRVMKFLWDLIRVRFTVAAIVAEVFTVVTALHTSDSRLSVISQHIRLDFGTGGRSVALSSWIGSKELKKVKQKEQRISL